MSLMIKKSLLTFLGILFFNTLIFSQSDTTVKKERFHQRVYYDVTNTAKAVIYVYKRPFTWKKKEWKIFGAVAGTSIAVSFLDEPINDYFKKNQTHFQNEVASFGNFMGQPEYQGPFLVAFWGLGVTSNNEWIRTTSTMLAASMAASGMIQTFSKEAVGRARPSSGDGNTSFKPFGGKAYHSFPSGHTMLSISSSWIMARQVNFLPLKIVFYAIPAIVGWSRLYNNAHWFSDIILGSALGIASAEAVIRYYSTIKKKDRSQAGLTVLPRGDGVSLIYRF